MVPPYSHRVSRVRRYSGYSLPTSLFAYETVTLFGVSSHTLQLSYVVRYAVLTPQVLLPVVWPAPRSLATTKGISVDVFSSPYLDVSVQAVPFVYLFDSVYDTLAGGFPHSEISGSQLICSSPKLIAAYHVLHRLLMPRHSPCALISLTFVEINSAKPALIQESMLTRVIVSPLKSKPACAGLLICNLKH